MKVIKSLNELNEFDYAVTIGNFDGVHCGHQKVIRNIKDECEKSNLKLVVVTFTPHPIQILNPKEHYLINSYSERRELLSELGIDYLFEIEFNRDISLMPPKDFLDEFIFNAKAPAKFYLGHDFAFGAQKKGNHSFVKKYCEDINTEVIVLCSFDVEGGKVSSTIVREALADGDVESVRKYLKRDYFIRGRVIKGAGRGRQIGIPTANLDLDRYRRYPKNGVYITKTKFGESTWYSVTNIGHNPTFTDGMGVFVETHILDFDNDIYGNEIEVSFIKRLRDEKKFDSVNDLIEQINLDVDKTREYFND
ncbi:bifunctional riboflavin kinase/FAD synthetase [Halobacteriovorax sp.]|uniref:bifunctional riboflavin kinase/FAD synthetase n=1 Tax=Halobacteriovorax sp. TaxID=2020862 RepID=UPI003AF29B33